MAKSWSCFFPRVVMASFLAFLPGACLLIGDFDGYGPLPTTIAPCATVTCNAKTPDGPCEPTVVNPSLLFGALSADTASVVIRRYDFDGSIVRVAKPGCSVPPLELPGVRPEFAVVDDDFLAWTTRGNGGTCIGASLFWCNPGSCKPAEIPVLQPQPEFEKLGGVTLGGDYLYYMLTDGLVGRVRRGQTTFETLWIDSDAYKQSVTASLLYGIVHRDDRLYLTRYAIGDDIEMSCDDGEKPTTGAVIAIDPVVGAEHTYLAQNIEFPTTLDVSSTHVYFFARDGALLQRVPRDGGAVEKLMPGGELVLTDSMNDYGLSVFPTIHVHGKWVYFAASTMNGGRAIARLPLDAPLSTSTAAEIVARPAGGFDFVVEDEALYWVECASGQSCETGSLHALVVER